QLRYRTSAASKLIHSKRQGGRGLCDAPVRFIVPPVKPLRKFSAKGFTMSFRAVGNVWNRSKKRGTHLLVLLAIADWENDDQGGVAYPAIPTLAKKTRLSERQLQRILRDLERSGELRVPPRAGRNGTNLYKTHLPTEIASKGESPVTGDACGPAPVSSGAPKGDTGATQSVKEPLYNSTPIVPE